MADTGKLAAEGYGAGAIKYALLDGFVPNPAALVNACLATMGLGTANTHKLLVDGFCMSPVISSGAHYIFEGLVLGGNSEGWL